MVYNADQFHFHRPTEHLFQGKSYEVEMHIVHSLISGAPPEYQYTKSVLAVIFDSSKDEINHFFDQLLTGNECEIDLQKLIDIIPNDFYHYQGSLTTPPCSEIVNWFVLKTPINISKDQAEKLASMWETTMHGCHDNREPQEVHGRVVYMN